jgi:hypothetical protein
MGLAGGRGMMETGVWHALKARSSSIEVHVWGTV